MFIKDARITQIIFLGLFLCLGVSTRDWTVQPDLILVIVTSCLATQWLLSAIAEYSRLSDDHSIANILCVHNILTSPKVLTSLRSALITSLGLCLEEVIPDHCAVCGSTVIIWIYMVLLLPCWHRLLMPFFALPWA